MSAPGSNEDKEPRFRVRAPLRCDGVGKLDCAEDVESGARMAIRWLPLDANGAAAARALELLPPHPTLPRIRSTGLRGSAAFVAMDFPDGKLLSTLSNELLNARTLARIGSEVADALATIHLQETFHGELSTDSVLLLPERSAVLWDVPLVVANRMTDRRAAERSSYTALRSAPFLAPERARGLPPSAPADVYALGAVLCLAGGSLSPPGVTTLAVVHQIATGQWTPQPPHHFPESMRELVGRMLATEPLMRPSAAQVAELLGRGGDELAGAESGLTGAQTEEAHFDPAFPGLRSKTPYVVAGVLAVVLLGLSGAGLRSWRRPSAAPMLAEPALPVSSPIPDVETSLLLSPLVGAEVGLDPGPALPSRPDGSQPRAPTPLQAAAASGAVAAPQPLSRKAPSPPVARVVVAKPSAKKRTAPQHRVPAARSPAAPPGVPELGLSGLLGDIEPASPRASPTSLETDLKRPTF